MFSLAELSTITVDPSESNTTCSEDSTIEESIWYILPYESVQNKKGLFLVWPLGVVFLTLQMGLLEFGLSLLVMIFFLLIQLLAPLYI